MQEGFDAGIRQSAKAAYPIAKLRGALRTVMVTTMLKRKVAFDFDAIQHCLDSLDVKDTRLKALSPAVCSQLETLFGLLSLHEMRDLVRNLSMVNQDEKQA